MEEHLTNSGSPQAASRPLTEVPGASFAEETKGLGDAAYYATHYLTRPPEQYTWLLAQVITGGKPGSVLDLGCGPGLFVEIASMWGLDARGLDGSEEAVRAALLRNPNLNIAHQLLGGLLPYSDAAIDNVVLNQVIEHLPAAVLLHVLSEVKRVLRKNGMVFIYSPNKANKREVLKDPTHINPLSPSELRSLLLSCGFEVVSEPNSARFSGRNPFLFRLYRALMRTSLRDWLSASSNAHARKP